MNTPRRLNELRAGVIGTGFIGPVHIEALQRLGVRVTALCDFDPAKAEATARKWNIPHLFTGPSFERMIGSDDVDVVHITAPNRFHYAMAAEALKAGKHCLCEKPLAMNTAETAKLLRAAGAAKVRFGVNYNVRFYPAVLQLRAMVASGELGDIIHVNGSYLQDWLHQPTDYNWRLLPEEGGKLRAVADIGTHWMDTVCFVLGSKIVGVFAHLETFHRTRKRPLGEVQTFTSGAAGPRRYRTYPVKTEDFASVLLRFASGAHGNLAVSQVAAGRKNCLRVEIYGSRRSAIWNSEDPNQIVCGNRDAANEVVLRNTPPFSSAVAGFTDYPAGHAEGFPDTFKMLFRNFYGSILDARSNAPLYATALDGHEEVRVCEAILRSHRQHRWVTL